MNHVTEEQLILHYYGEEGDTLAVESHLDDCEECRARYSAYQRVLNVVDSLPLPERSPGYEAELWRRLAPQIGSTRRRFAWPVLFPWRLATAGVALAGLMTVAFLAGRFLPHNHTARPNEIAAAAADPQAVLLVAMGDYLERSQMVLVELANANPKAPLDISAERERAADLVSENRLYRQTAEHIGNTSVSNVLEDLDRVLLEIAHSPSQLSPEELEQLRERFQSEGILFKIRVLGSNVRNQEGAGARL